MKLEYGILNFMARSQMPLGFADRIKALQEKTFENWIKQSKAGYRNLDILILKLRFKARFKEALENIKKDPRRFRREMGLREV